MTRTAFVLFVLVCLGAVALFTVPAGAEGSADTPDCGGVNAEVAVGDGTVLRLHSVAPGSAELPERVALDRQGDACFVPGDRLVVTIRSSGLADELAAAEGRDLTEKFVATQGDGTSVQVQQSNPGSSQRPLTVDLSDAANLTVVEGETADTYHVVVDTGAVDVSRGEAGDESVGAETFQAGQRFVASYEGETETARSGQIEAVSPTAHVETNYHDWDEQRALLYPPGATFEVTGTTTLAPGDEATVQLLDDNGSTVVQERSLTLAAPGDGGARSAFATGLDGSSFSVGDRLTVRVVHDGEPVSEPVPVEFVPRTASLTLENQTATTEITLASATLSHGGFVSLRQNGNLVAVSDFLDRGETRNVTFELVSRIDADSEFTVTAIRDVNGNGEIDDGDVPYRRSGALVTDSATVGPPATTTVESKTATATSSPTESTAEQTATTETDAAGETDAGASTPGFGPLGALLAMLTVAFAVRNR
ncbi:DUF7282 domain-containing protein [Haloarchaeobius sp. TZWWS8]|uniref:DUF7282 domain-containing protein n=1 Tax=Haloarchaeobius sp. TZWWS8 TaxID=3446121 RepID=UPI003EBFDD85